MKLKKLKNLFIYLLLFTPLSLGMISCSDNNKSNVNSMLDIFKNYYLDQGFENPYNKNDDAIVRTGSGGDNVDGRLRLDETECPGGYGNGTMITLRAKTHKEVQLSLIKPDGWCK